MSMTKEEIIKKYEMVVEGGELVASFMGEDVKEVYEMLKAGLSALRPITRERLEKVWKGACDCSKPKACCTCCSMRCQYCIGQSEYRQATFCMKCGRPLTDEAVDMVMERLEALKDGSETD